VAGSIVFQALAVSPAYVSKKDGAFAYRKAGNFAETLSAGGTKD
jgi:hypothetical protein